MLNRKLSEYLFYGSLAFITLVVLLINTVLMGNMNDKIDTTNNEIISLQAQIDDLTEIVQDNKDSQTSYIYELYDQVPGVYSGTELTYQTISILERLGITESTDYQRRVYVNSNIAFSPESQFYDLSTTYEFVEVEIFFTTQDAQLVSDVLDAMYNSNQIFIVNEITYRVPDGEDYLGITINLLAMYDVELEEESN